MINLPSKEIYIKATTIFYLTTTKLTKCRCWTIPKAGNDVEKPNHPYIQHNVPTLEDSLEISCKTKHVVI